MNNSKFSAIMSVLVPQIVRLIQEKNTVDEIAASDMFYRSEVYALLEQEKTKLWHFSPLTLYTMFAEEQQTGAFEIPEEI